MNDDVDFIRSRLRNNIQEERTHNRESSMDNRRRELGCIVDKTYSIDDIVQVANGLKTKGHVNTEDLAVLKNGLIANEDNISIFFKVHGSLHGLIKEFTGTNATNQLLAAECICNLSLGPAKICYTVAKAAGAYLITYLDSSNLHLVEVCAWSLGNLLCCEEKVVTLLKAQGLLEKLIPLLGAHHQESVISSAAYAIGHLLSHNIQLIENEKIHDILNTVAEHIHFTDYVSRILFILSCLNSLDSLLIWKEIFTKIIMELVHLTNQNSLESEIVNIDTLLRTAANLCCNPNITTEKNLIIDKNVKNAVVNLSQCQYKEIIQDVLWFLGNAFNNISDEEFKNIFKSHFENLFNT